MSSEFINTESLLEWNRRITEEMDFCRTSNSNQWISIKEKTPLRDEMVLVYCPEEVTKIRPCQFSDWGDAEELGITYWMKISEPPKI